MARTPFKMKSSPTKGKLGDFFKGLGSQLKAGQKDRGIFSEKGRAEKKEMRKTRESKYQYDVRKRREGTKTITSKAEPSASLTNEEKGLAKGKDRKGYVVPKTNKKTKTTKTGKKVKADKKITGALGSKTRKEQYDAKGWRYDETIKGYNRDGTKIKTKVKTKVKKTKLGQVDPKTGSVNVDYVGEKKAPIKNYKKGYYKK